MPAHILYSEGLLQGLRIAEYSSALQNLHRGMLLSPLSIEPVVTEV